MSTTGDHMTLAEQTARRLILAGITWNDPGLIIIREWNKAAYERQALSAHQGEG